MDRKKLLLEVGEVLDTYCQDCFVKEFFRKERGKRYAQSFCIKNCTVGEKLKEYGRKLS
ncbi:zinc-finger domain-containing protein [Fredinandcohnia humi]